MIIENDKSRIVVINGKEYENVLGLYTRYRYVPPYRCDVHQVPVESKKREKIESIISDAERENTKEVTRIVAMVVDAKTKTKKVIREDGEEIEEMTK